MEYINGDELVCNTDFIDWIVRYTNDETIFSDDYPVLFPDLIAEEDMGYIEKLSFFYVGILNYLAENYLYPEKTEFSNFVKIKYKGLGFEIGVIFGQGSITYCNRIPIDDENGFIDFMDILLKKKQDNYNFINEQLNNLSNMIKQLSQSGIPKEALENTIFSCLKEINKEEYGERKLTK